MKTPRNTRENCVKLFNAMIENKRNLLGSMREDGKNKDNSRLYTALLDDVVTLGIVVDILTNKSDFDAYWDIYELTNKCDFDKKFDIYNGLTDE